MSRRHRSGDAGQSTVELALVLPFVFVCLMAVVQVGVLVHDQILVVHAAREAARAAAVGDDPRSPAQAARDAGDLDARALRVEVGPRGAPGTAVDVEVIYTEHTDVPLVGPLLPDVELRARASMRVE